MHHQRCTRQWMRSDESSSDVWCMYAWSRPNDLQKSRRWWLNNILPFRGSLFSRLNSTMVFLILFARYAADSNAMQWWSSVQNLQSEDVIAFLYVDEWRQSSGTEVTVVSKVQHQLAQIKMMPHVAYLLISCLPAGQWRRSVAFWKALEVLYRLGV